MAGRLRILYVAGPGNVIDTYGHWTHGRDDPSQVSVAYSHQFYDVCREFDAEAMLLSSCPTRKTLQDGRFTLLQRPTPLRHSRSLPYYLGQLWHAVRIIIATSRFQADVVIVGETTFWFVLSALRCMRVRIVPALHCVPWARFKARSFPQRALWRLNRRLFAKDCFAIMSASRSIDEQIAEVTAGQPRPIVSFLPTYRENTFSGIAKPDRRNKPFRVFFAGRIEPSKGVYDILAMAEKLGREGHTGIEFDICGDGSALADLKQRAVEANLAGVVHCHGYCERGLIRDLLSRSHAVIVPTRIGFVEGFNQVVAEGVLCGRPVITSAVCPAVEYVRDAIVEVPPDDVDAYADAITRLSEDKEYYEEKRSACARYAAQFHDTRRGWAAALRSILQATRDDTDPEPVSWLPEEDADCADFRERGA